VKTMAVVFKGCACLLHLMNGPTNCNVSPLQHTTPSTHTLEAEQSRAFIKYALKFLFFQTGVTHCAYERAQQYCANYNHPLDGPISLGVDGTALLESVCPFFDPVLKKRFAIGLAGDPVEVNCDMLMIFSNCLKILGNHRLTNSNYGHYKSSFLTSLC